MSDAPLTDAQLVRQFFMYDPSTGILSYRRWPGAKLHGKPAGSSTGKYVICTFKSKYVAAHKLAWLYVFGQWPDGTIKHVNGDTKDNRIANLKLLERGFISSDPNNPDGPQKSPYIGVSFHKASKKWIAQIRDNGKKRTIGYFKRPEDAAEAYKKAAKEIGRLL